MQIFMMHVGHPGNIDIDYTVTQTRTIDEILKKLPIEAPERLYFEKDLPMAFPNGSFNCWGIPPRAEPAFRQTNIGDLVLIIPFIGIHSGSGVRQIGIVKAKIPVRCYDASRILWPNTPDRRLFPHIFFFNTELVWRGWFSFLDDLGFDERWNPRGWYRVIANHRFQRWGGTEGYLRFLREECGFHR